MQPMNPIPLWPTAALVLGAAVTDLRSRRIPNALVLPFLVLAIVSAALSDGWSGVGQSLLGAGIGAGAMAAFCVLGGMGMGDLKLFAAVGAWIWPSQLVMALIMTSLCGGVMAILWAVARGFFWESMRGTAGLIMGKRGGLTLANPASRKMPYAPAIALGTLLSFFGRQL
jgi:prepilin peptidase CpaA